MKVVRFRRRHQLLVVDAQLWGPRGFAKLKLAVDTGAGETLIVPEILDGLGYSVRDGEGVTVIRSAVAAEPGYLQRVSRFRTLGHEFANFRVHAHDLPDGFHFDGLLGLNVLDHFNYEIRSGEGRIRVERVAA